MSPRYEFIERGADPDRFEAEADDYCRRRSLDYRYLAAFRTYQAQYSNRMVADRSFLVCGEGRVAGLAYAPIEENDDTRTLGIGNGGYAPAPACDDEAAEAAAFARLDAIAQAEGAGKAALHACTGTHAWTWNRLRAHGFVNTSVLDAIVDLTLDEAALWRSVRKSYKALINKYSNGNGCETLIIDAANPDRALHETYRHLHAKCAGRVTRGPATFEQQFRMLVEGCATLIVLKGDAGILGCAYFLHHGTTVDYFSMADDPDFAGLRLPVSHVIVWAAVRHFRARGFTLLRLSPPAGFAAVEGFGAYAEPKELAIAHFKHGIATGTCPQFRGIRYWSRAAFEQDLERFRAVLAQALGETQR